MTRSDVLGLVAVAVFAGACLFAGTFQLRDVLYLNENGAPAIAQVAAMERGAKGGRWPVYAFTTESGEPIRARDFMQRMLAPIDTGDSVPVLYDPDATSRVTADLDPWRWRAPALFYGGAIILLAVGLAIWLAARRAAQDSSDTDRA